MENIFIMITYEKGNVGNLNDRKYRSMRKLKKNEIFKKQIYYMRY